MAEHEWIFPRGDGQFVYAWVPDPSTPSKRAQSRLPRTLRTKRDAKRYVEEHRDTIRAGKVQSTERRGPTWGDLAKRWKELRAADERAATSTIRDNISHVNTHILPEFGDEEAESLDIPRVRKFVRSLRTKVAPYTARNVMASFALFVDTVIAEQWAKLPANPVRERAVRSELPDMAPRVGRSHKLRVEDVSVAQRLMLCPSVPVDRRVRYAVTLPGGERDGELAGLIWTDVELDAEPPVLHIRRALQLKGKSGHATIGKTKTSYSVRDVPLHPVSVAALRWWRDIGWERHCGRIRTDIDTVFINTQGKAWRPRSAEMFRADLEAIGEASSIDGHNLTFHAIRRSFSTWLASAGVPKEARDYLLGHTPRDVGERHYTAKDMRLLAEYVRRIPMEWTDP